MRINVFRTSAPRDQFFGEATTFFDGHAIDGFNMSADEQTRFSAAWVDAQNRVGARGQGIEFFLRDIPVAELAQRLRVVMDPNQPFQGIAFGFRQRIVANPHRRELRIRAFGRWDLST